MKLSSESIRCGTVEQEELVLLRRQLQQAEMLGCIRAGLKISDSRVKRRDRDSGDEGKNKSAF